MTLALRSPEIVANIIAVDNAPVDVALDGNFARYIHGMERVESASITRQADADKLLQKCEQVSGAERGGIQKNTVNQVFRQTNVAGPFYTAL